MKQQTADRVIPIESRISILKEWLEKYRLLSGVYPDRLRLLESGVERLENAASEPEIEAIIAALEIYIRQWNLIVPQEA